MPKRPTSTCLIAAMLSLSPFFGQPATAQTNVTIHANAHQSIGGVGQLNRSQYFNHWGTHVPPTNTNLGNLATQVWQDDQLNSVTGRETFEYDGLIAAGLPEDPANPGFFKTSDLVGKLQGSYKNWVLNNQRWESLRVTPDAILVQSGRANGSWPSWIKDGTTMPMKNGGLAYAQLLNTYLEEVVYGTGPGQGYLPIPKENFYIEIMNEPQLELTGGVTWNDVITFHKNVTETVKAQYPQAKLGGAAVGDAPYQPWNPHRWDLIKQMMDDMTTWSAEFDFWTIHPYQWFNVNSSGVLNEITRNSPGHVTANMDLFEAYSNKLFGDPKQFAITEYGRAGDSALGTNNFGSYSREQRQWDLNKAVREMMAEFMLRPDRIINATPFIAPQWWTGSTPTEESGYFTLWDKDASGNWVETVNGKMYRMYNNISGEYIPIDDDNLDLQTVAFRNGNQVYVILNNLNNANHTVNLQALTGLGNVVAASMDRLLWSGSSHLYVDDQDVSASWQNLTLLPEEGAVLTLTLDGPQLFDIAYNEDTYYSPVTEENLSQILGRTSIMPINADLQDAVSARIRVGFERPNAPAGESFDVIVNGNVVTVPATGTIGYDESNTVRDQWLVSREVEIPLNFLVDGVNNVVIDFATDGGKMISTVLVVTRTVGDFNNSGAFDPNDVSLLAAQFGPASPGSRYDLNNDGIIDFADVQHLVQNLRGTLLEDLDLDGFVGIQDLNLILSNWNSSVNPGDTAMGDPSGDGFVGIEDLNLILGSWNAGTPPPADVLGNVPEPATIIVLGTIGTVLLKRKNTIQ